MPRGMQGRYRRRVRRRDERREGGNSVQDESVTLSQEQSESIQTALAECNRFSGFEQLHQELERRSITDPQNHTLEAELVHVTKLLYLHAWIFFLKGLTPSVQLDSSLDAFIAVALGNYINSSDTSCRDRIPLVRERVNTFVENVQQSLFPVPVQEPPPSYVPRPSLGALAYEAEEARLAEAAARRVAEENARAAQAEAAAARSEVEAQAALLAEARAAAQAASDRADEEAAARQAAELRAAGDVTADDDWEYLDRADFGLGNDSDSDSESGDAEVTADGYKVGFMGQVYRAGDSVTVPTSIGELADDAAKAVTEATLSGANSTVSAVSGAVNSAMDAVSNWLGHLKPGGSY